MVQIASGRRGLRGRWAALCAAGALAACGGGAGDGASDASSDNNPLAAPAMQAQSASPGAEATITRGDGATLAAMAAALRLDATRLAQQASFGPTEALINDIKAQGGPAWVAQQMALDVSRYTSGGGDGIHRNVGPTFFCDTAAQAGNPNCWRDYYSTEPLLWDFYRQAVSGPDQLRQRVALALQQVLVVSNLEVSGTYGFRLYYNNLRSLAFGNYRDVLRKVALSPVMGEYLDHVNNDKTLPNENFARELLQLFTVGTCLLNADGTLAGGNCQPTYDNDRVRAYAYALTGWTFPPGGSTTWGCWPEGANCEYMGADMVAAPALRNTDARTLLSGVTVPAGATSAQALESVLDSVMKHPNIGPFVARRLIQNLVSSNPTPAYVGRVATAFTSGRFRSGTTRFGTGTAGDLAATVAAVLLDAEARGSATTGGYLRDPLLQFTGVLRALNGHTDGAALGWWWGESLRQHVFMPPSVFNDYPPDYPVSGTAQVGPQFGIHNANTALERLNYLTYLMDWGGSAPEADIPNAIGTAVDLAPFETLADNAGTLVDNLSLIALGRTLAATPRAKVVAAVEWWNAQTSPTDWRHERAATAAYLVFASPDYQVQR